MFTCKECSFEFVFDDIKTEDSKGNYGWFCPNCDATIPKDDLRFVVL